MRNVFYPILLGFCRKGTIVAHEEFPTTFTYEDRKIKT